MIEFYSACKTTTTLHISDLYHTHHYILWYGMFESAKIICTILAKTWHDIISSFDRPSLSHNHYIVNINIIQYNPVYSTKNVIGIQRYINCVKYFNSRTWTELELCFWLIYKNANLTEPNNSYRTGTEPNRNRTSVIFSSISKYFTVLGTRTAGTSWTR